MEKFRLSPRTQGLPDQYIHDEHRKVSMTPLRQFFRLDRKQSKAIETQLKKGHSSNASFSGGRSLLIDLHADPENRRHFFFKELTEQYDLPNEQSEISHSRKEESLDPKCWDMLVLKPLLNRAISERSERKDACLESSEVGIKEYITTILDDVQDLVEQRIAEWDELPPEERQTLSDQVFSISILHCAEMFNRCLDQCEGFNKYFTELMAFDYNWKPEVIHYKHYAERGTHEEADEDSPTLTKNIKSLSITEIHEDLRKAVHDGEVTPYDLGQAELILLLAQTLVDKVKAEKERPEISDVLRAWCGRLFHAGVEAGLSLFNEDNGSFQRRLLDHWIDYFRSQVAEEFTAESLEELFKNALQDAARLAKAYETLVQEKAALVSEINRIGVDSAPNVLEKRARQKAENEVNNKLNKKDAERLELEDQITLALLPPKYTMDAFLDSKAPTYDQDNPELPDGIMQALKALPTTLFVLAEGEADTRLHDGEMANTCAHPSPPEPEITPETNIEENEADTQVTTADNTTAVTAAEQETKVIEETHTVVEEESKAVSELSSIDEASHGRATPLVSPKTPLGASDQFLADLDQGALSTETINRLCVWMIQEGRLPIAYSFLKQIEQLSVEVGHFSSLLIKAAYYGAHTWNYGPSLTKSQGLLATLTRESIDELAGQPHGEIVPYLVLAAVFQPALFGGAFTRAPYELASLAQQFDKGTKQLIGTTAELSTRNQFVTLEDLGSEGDNRLESKFDPEESLAPWVQKIRASHRGYAPVLKAQAKCLEAGAFQPIVEILQADDKSRIAKVESFVAEMQSESASDELLEESLKLAGQSLSFVDIFMRERRGFHTKVMELVEIAKQWLAVVKPKDTSDIDKYCLRFTTRLNQSIIDFETRSKDRNLSDAHRAGAATVAASFIRLRSVIQGAHSLAWDARQAKAWFKLPNAQAQQNDIGKGPLPRIQWLLDQMDRPTDLRTLFNHALKKGNISIAESVLCKIQETGKGQPEDAQRIAQRFDTLKYTLIQKSKRMQGQVDNANLSSLVDDETAEKLVAELDLIQDDLETLGHLDDVEEIRDRLDAVEHDISSKTNNKKAKLHEDYQRQMVKLRALIPDDPVPQQWVEDIEEAFENDNLPVIAEMIDELSTAVQHGRRIQFSRIQQVPVLAEFLEAEPRIQEGIAQCRRNKRDIWHHVVETDNHFGIAFPSNPSGLKKTLEILSGFYLTSRPSKNLTKELYEQVAYLLQFLGFTPKRTVYRGQLKDSSNYTTTQGAAAFNVEIEPAGSLKPFPLLGESAQPRLMVLLALQTWKPEQLEMLYSQPDFSHSIPLLISAQPISLEKRNDFARHCKQSQKTVLHLDIAMALFLGHYGVIEAENADLRNFLWLSMPFTYYNPYVSTRTTRPPPREIRYGREREINSLLEMHNGSAIVFGGRQLGKSTILQELHSRFHQPERQQFAYYHLLDDMARIGLTAADWERTEIKVWGYIYDYLNRSGLISQARNGQKPDELQAKVKLALKENPSAKVIIIFDEIDPVLNVDNAHDFKLVRALRNPVNDPEIQGRFKIVIGGLESVKRFENSPNFPLHQLGGSIQVTIMPTQDALQLIREPFNSLGYRFENSHVLNRILALTNRHPGLIQIFCHELVKFLSTNQRTPVGQCVINDDDVSAVYQLEEVIDLIRKRFEMTLNLDLRYLVIIYGMIYEGKASKPFLPRDAKEVAEYWLPDEFTKLSDKQFEAFLTELVGLGVLRMEKEGLSNRYIVRNTNVIRLLGADAAQGVEEQLQRALDEFLSSDPLDRHACVKRQDELFLSPITYRDEKEILGAIIKEQAGTELGRPITRHYSVSLIVGSEAQGAGALMTALPYVYEAISTSNEDDNYKRIIKAGNSFTSAQAFSDFLGSILEKQAQFQPIMLFMNIGADIPLATLLAMIDAAHQFNSAPFANKLPFRMIFILSPEAYYHWLQAPDLTREREGLQPFIKLGKWGKAALRYALDKLGLPSATDDVDQLENYSEGWYYSLDILVKTINARKGETTELRQLRKYVPIQEMKPAEAKRFIKAAGLYQFDWALPLIRAIQASDIEEVNAEDLQLIAEENEICGDDSIDTLEQKALWLSDMDLLRRTRKTNRRNYYSLVPLVMRAAELADEAH